MGIYARGVIESLFELIARDGHSDLEVVIYGDGAILDSDLLNRLSLSPVLSARSEAAFDLGAKRYFKKLANGKRTQVLFRFLPELINRGLNFFWDQALLPFVFAFDKIEVIHCLTNYGLLLTSVPQIVTVHDLFQAYPPELPEYLPEKLRNKMSFKKRLVRSFYRALFKLQFKKIRHAVTVSHHVVASIKERYNFDLARVTAVPSGVDKAILEYFNFQESVEEESKRLAFRTQYLGHEPGYVFHIASFDPRKNTYGALMAWKSLPEEAKEKGLLVQAESYLLKRYVLKILEEDAEKHLQFVPWVDREQLLDILSASGVLLFPSLAEGFGLPALEALTLGTRVVSSDLDALKGELKKKLYLCDTSKLESIGQALGRAIDDIPRDKSQNPLELTQQSKTIYSMIDATSLLFPIYRKVILQNKR